MLDGLSETVSAARVDGRSRTRAALEAWGTDRQELEQGVPLELQGVFVSTSTNER